MIQFDHAVKYNGKYYPPNTPIQERAPKAAKDDKEAKDDVAPKAAKGQKKGGS